MPVKEDEHHVFFYGRDTIFSQFYPCRFIENGQSFICAEQYMQYKKAKLFGDNQCGQLILASESPIQHKRFGRRVKPFSERIWSNQAKSIVKRGSMHKFQQNRTLKQRLLNTYPKQLVETSPYDRTWGIGLSIEDLKIHDPSRWRGSNILGQILAEVREELYAENNQHKGDCSPEIPVDNNKVSKQINIISI